MGVLNFFKEVFDFFKRKCLSSDAWIEITQPYSAENPELATTVGRGEIYAPGIGSLMSPYLIRGDIRKLKITLEEYYSADDKNYLKALNLAMFYADNYRTSQAVTLCNRILSQDIPLAVRKQTEALKQEVLWEAKRKSTSDSPKETMSYVPEAISHFKEAEGYRKTKDFLMAEIFYRNALAEDPEFAAAYNSLGLVIAMQSKDKEDEARNYWKKALALVPDYGAAKQNIEALDKGFHPIDFAGASK